MWAWCVCMLHEGAAKALLGLERPLPLDEGGLADQLAVTFFPKVPESASDEVRRFAGELREALVAAGVEVVPYEEALTEVPRKKLAKWYGLAVLSDLKKPFDRLAGNEDASHRPGLAEMVEYRVGPKVRPGVSIIAIGGGETGDLPVDHTLSFRDTTIVTLTDMPEGTDENTDFITHFNQALELFAHHMSNHLLCVAPDRWLLYNFNGAHPTYPRSGDLVDQVRRSLVPKLAAPIRPPRLRAFEVRPDAFDPLDDQHRAAAQDITSSGALLEQTRLYPPGRAIDDLPFRSKLYRWAGAVHLDSRNGMSYGFLARQLPAPLAPLLPADEAAHRWGLPPPGEEGVVDHEGRLHLALELPGEGTFVAQAPDVWVLTQRSGANKTRIDPTRDLVKMGLVQGRMVLALPHGVAATDGFRPSFDTRVILAHALGNTLVASALAHRDADDPFARMVREEGLAMAHFHGYLDRRQLPGGWHVHGAERPPVACGTPQAAMYALLGKLDAFSRAYAEGSKFLGDVHVEPQHGSLLTFPTLTELGEFLAQGEVAALGNRFERDYVS